VALPRGGTYKPIMRVPGASLLELKRQANGSAGSRSSDTAMRSPTTTRHTLPDPLEIQKTAFGQLPSTRVSRLSSAS
jgi:hypothetical protein